MVLLKLSERDLLSDVKERLAPVLDTCATAFMHRTSTSNFELLFTQAI